MSTTTTSVFDLSPSEKLQLVEDLWDDLAATSPEAVPVHDWQKEELARRKANLLRDPASGLGWEEVVRLRSLLRDPVRDTLATLPQGSASIFSARTAVRAWIRLECGSACLWNHFTNGKLPGASVTTLISVD